MTQKIKYAQDPYRYLTKNPTRMWYRTDLQKTSTQIRIFIFSYGPTIRHRSKKIQGVFFSLFCFVLFLPSVFQSLPFTQGKILYSLMIIPFIYIIGDYVKILLRNKLYSIFICPENWKSL